MSHRKTSMLPVLLPALLLALATGCAPTPREASMSVVPEVAERLAQFAPTVVEADLSGLSDGERQVLDRLVQAGRHLDEAFLLQAWEHNPAFRERLEAEGAEQARATLAYFDIMYGPWDRQAHREPFAGLAAPWDGVNMRPHPPGAGFYPDDLTREEFETYLADHPEEKDVLLGWYTVVRRDGDRLVAVPYSEAYREQLEPAAALLREAAGLTDNETLRTFLQLRADAFLSDDYYASEKAWMDLDSRIEVTIGPYEVYEDGLMATKTAFEAFVTVSDPQASADLARFKNLLPDMEQHLPIPDSLKTERGAESPIRVVDLAFSGGDTRAGVQTIAFNLPNDERIRTEKGSKKVLLRNVMKVKFETILRPIAAEVIDPSQQDLLAADAFFNQTLFHELSHGLGPGYVTGREGVEVRAALQELYSALEEAKADAMGAYNILYMVDREEFPAVFREQLLVTYFAGLFRSVRFGTSEAHGKGAALQLNRYLEEGAATLGDDGRFTVDLFALESAVRGLVRDICLIQAAGDKEKAGLLLEEKGKLTPPIQQALDRLENVPVDIRPVYPAAGESLPQ